MSRMQRGLHLEPTVISLVTQHNTECRPVSVTIFKHFRTSKEYILIKEATVMGLDYGLPCLLENVFSLKYNTRHSKLK